MTNAEAIEVLRANYPDACYEQLREAVDMAIEALKAQLFHDGTTSDLISRTETVERLRRVLDATVPITDYDSGYVDGVEFGVSTVSTMPTVQPQSTTGQLNDSAQSTDLIDRQAALNALMDAVKSVGVLDADDIKTVFDALPSVQHEKAQLSSEDATKDAISKTETVEHLRRVLEATVPNTDYDEGYIDGVEFGISTVSTMPTIQPETKEGHWIKHESPDGGEQYECSRCGVLWEFNDGTPEDNEAYFCPKCGTKMKGEPNARTD